MSTLLGIELGAVEARRDAAADALAAELGTTRAQAWSRACELAEEAWPGPSAATPGLSLRNGVATPAAAGSPDVGPPRTAGAPVDGPERTGHWRLLAVAALAVVAVVALIALATRGDDHAAGSATVPASASSVATPAVSAPASSTPAPAAAAPARPTSGPAGTAVVASDGATARLVISGLDPGAYEVWLFTDVIGARPLAGLRGPGGTLTVTLPSDARRFAYLDVSRQPQGRTVEHSGLSVLRVPTRELRPGASASLVRPGI